MSDVVKYREDLFDKIERFYKEDGKLTDSEKKICERYEIAFSLLAEHRSKKVAIKKYMALLESKGEAVSLNVAYKDFSNAETIFTPIHKISKEFHRMVLSESLNNDIIKLEEKQKTDGISLKDYLAIQEQINKCKDLIIKSEGLQKDDPNLPDFSQIQMPDLQINVSPGVEKLLKLISAKGVVDTTELSKFDDAEILDI